MSDFSEILGLDATAQAESIRRKDIKAIELVDAVIERIEHLNPVLNAVVTPIYKFARDEAKGTLPDGPFKGVPFLIKDLIAEYEGTPFCEGSHAVKGYISKVDSELVRRQRANGLIIVGKTNTPEFGTIPSMEHSCYGPTKNPWNLDLTPGGSSGGSAAAVASGIIPMAHGNDAGGSIRIPASCCGLFGLKPTRARNPFGPLFGDMGGGLVCEHAITRTVRDSAALLDVTSGSDLGDPYAAPHKQRPFLDEVEKMPKRLKIGFLYSVPEGWNDKTDLHPDCKNAVEDAAKLCENLGHTVEEINPNLLGYPKITDHFSIVFCCLVGQFIAYWENEMGKKIDKDELQKINWDTYQYSLNITGADYLIAQEEIQRFSRKIAQWYSGGEYDLLLSPTMQIPPTKLGEMKFTPENQQGFSDNIKSFICFTRIQNLTGQPAMSVPLFWNESNMPIGVQFAGRFGDEATLFQLAAQLEESRPWADKIPSIHCDNLL